MNNENVLNIDGSHNGYDYVALGLPSGTMWATCNVGANKPEDDGLLFQFGRVDGYKYRDTNHKFITNKQNLEDGSIVEYANVTTSRKTYKCGDILDLTDDAAHINMGGEWRMPTYVELEELHNNTTHNIETVNGVNGIMLISNINNKKIFIPFAGYWYNGTFCARGFNCNMWASQVDKDYKNHAYRFSYNSIGYGNVDVNFHSFALSVRGVFKK